MPETPVLRIVEFRQHRFREGDGKIQVPRFERHLIESQHAGKQKCVGFEQLHVVALAIAPAVIERAAARALFPELGLKKGHIPFCRLAIFLLAQDCIGARHRAQHQSVP